MLRKALSLSGMPYKSGGICSETEGRMAPFCSFCSRLGGNAPKSEAATGLARAIFIRHLPILDGYAPKNHWILGRVTGWSCSELRSLVQFVVVLTYARPGFPDSARRGMML